MSANRQTVLINPHQLVAQVKSAQGLVDRGPDRVNQVHVAPPPLLPELVYQGMFERIAQRTHISLIMDDGNVQQTAACGCAQEFGYPAKADPNEAGPLPNQIMVRWPGPS